VTEYTKTDDNILADGHPLLGPAFAGPPLREEWAVKYRDPDGVMGAEKWHYIECSDRQAAERIVGWTQSVWIYREKIIVRRYITDWEEVNETATSNGH
jgi:hypothetical protein